MNRSKFTEQQIVFALQQAENGVKVPEVCRKMGIHEATFNFMKPFIISILLFISLTQSV